MTPRKKTTSSDDQPTTDGNEAPKKRTPARRKKAVAFHPKPDSPQPEHIAESSNPSVARAYLEDVGRRKTAIARVRLWKGSSKPSVTVNQKPWEAYFRTETLQATVSSPLKAVGQWGKIELTCHVHGGGIIGQSEAVRHGIARVLLQLNPVFRKALKKAGFLRRDPREKERKKYGLKGARRAPQWQKR